MPELEIVRRPYDDPDVTRLIDEVQAEYVTMYGGPDAATVEANEFAPPNGLLLLGLLDGEPVMTGGWRRLPGRSVGQVAELKRMFVRSSVRRRGFARVMLAELERSAAAAGIEQLVLNTGRPQRAAVALYRLAGYAEAAPFGHYATAPDALFFGKLLDPVRPSPAAATGT